MPTTPPTIQALPTPPSRNNPSTFATLADAFLGALPTMRSEMNAAATNVYNNAVEADADAVAADASRVAAAASQSSAAASASTATTQAAAASASASAAAASATTANTKAGEAAGSAASALAIYGNTAAQQAGVIAAQNAASVAAGHAASASSVVQQDLSGVNAAALHRSPNAITAMFVYDTSKDSDGGAWTEKCQHTSWWNEAVFGRWLGARATEDQARFLGASVGAELAGAILNGTAGWSFSGNATVAGGAVVFNVAPNSGALAQYNPILTSGKWYQAVITLTGVGRLDVQFGSTGTNVTMFAPGTYSVYGVASGATPTVLTLNCPSSSVTNFVGSVSALSVREVTATTTAANDYFQLTTDGKFYRLNKNLLTNTATLSTQTQWLTAGTYTLSSTTASSGSVAVSGAATASHTAGGAATTFTVATSGNVTFTVTGSVTTAQCELGSTATTYEASGASRVTRVFRGNKRDFPRLAAILSADASVNIYDLTEPGLPMWMSIAGNWRGPSDPISNILTLLLGGGTVTGLSAVNGVLAIACNNNTNEPIKFINFISERAEGGIYRYRGTIAERNSELGHVAATSALGLTSSTAYAVSGTVLSNAPIDPVSGLPSPTFAVAHAGGISIIRNERESVHSSSTSSFDTVTLTPSLLTAGRADGTFYYAANPGQLGASFTLSTRTNSQAPDFGQGNTSKLVASSRADILRDSSTSALVQRLRNHETDPARGLAATITNLFNTGHQPGDIRRTFLSDNAAGSVVGTELLTNGTFATDTTGWTAVSGTPTLSVSSGILTISTNHSIYQAVQLQIGRSYRLTITGLTAGNGVANGANIRINSTLDSQWTNGDYFRTDTPTALQRVVITARHSTVYLIIDNKNSSAYITIDDVSIKGVVADRSYKARGADVTGTLTCSEVAAAAELVAYSGFSVSNYAQEPYSADLDFGTGEWSCSAWANIASGNSAAGTIAAREHTSGAYIRLGITTANAFTASVFDGTTTRSVTTGARRTATWQKVEVCYTTDGTLSIRTNGVEVSTARGNPLLTLNNSSSTLTIGNSQALDAPFPGSIALLKLSATVPTAEQSVWMYEQEKQLFRAGAKCCLPDSGNIVDLTYDDATDRWIAVSAANESEWAGLVRTSVTPVPAGSYTRAAAASGIQLLARSTTNPGVDVSIPAYGLREELVRRAEAAARLNKDLVAFDYVGGFTATTVNGNTAITSVANLSYPGSVVGAAVTGSGIPAGATIVAISGTTVYLSAAATASASGVQINFTDFHLPVGYEAEEVSSAGTAKQEGATKDWTRRFDGFRETIRFGTAPGNTTWVQIQASRSVQ
jgi:hypothetical protein